MTETTKTKAVQSAEHIQQILDRFWQSNAENVRLREEVSILRLQIQRMKSRDPEPSEDDPCSTSTTPPAASEASQGASEGHRSNIEMTTSKLNGEI